MNRKGFTLVELLATIVVLIIVVGITVVMVNGGFGNAKKKTEDIFVKTITDALDIYIDTEATKFNYSFECASTISKGHGQNVKVYKVQDAKTFEDVLNSNYSSLTLSDLVNPANKDNDNYQCFRKNDGSIDYGNLYLYRDEDYVYYYKISKNDFRCLNDTTGVITNLPSGFNC